MWSAIYYIGETPVANRETLVFDISVQPEGEESHRMCASSASFTLTPDKRLRNSDKRAPSARFLLLAIPQK